MTDIVSRKSQHLELSQNPAAQTLLSPFSLYKLKYKALPEIDLSSVDTGINLSAKRLSQPLIIASMTGGSEHALQINQNLAVACEKMQVAMGVGSQRVALENAQAEGSFKIVRKNAPTAFIFANIGGVQLNYGVGVTEVQRLIDMVEADALYIHLNPLQEALQPNGDANFSNLLGKIKDLVKQAGIPVYVKEVGHGLDIDTCEKLIDAGVSGLDVAGVGGTSWAWIEAQRANNLNFSEWFKDFGYQTDYVLKQLAKFKNKVKLVASGGVRSPVDGLKGLALGAHYYSAAQPFLLAALQGEDAVVELVKNWQEGLKIAMFCCGLTSTSQITESLIFVP